MKEPMSNYEHFRISLGSFRNIPMAVGDYSGTQVENFSSGKWNILSDFPFAQSYIRRFSTVSFNSDMFMFGKF